MKKIYSNYLQIILSSLILLMSSQLYVFASHAPKAEILTAPEFLEGGSWVEEDYVGLKFENHNAGGSTEIYYSLQADGPYTLLAAVGYRVTSYTHSNLKPRTIYYYKLRATLGSDTSPFSEIFSVRTFSKNYPPDFTAKAVNATIIELTLTDKSYNDIGYYIQSLTGPADCYSTSDYYQEVYFDTDSGSTKKVFHYPVDPGKTYYYTVTLIPDYDQSEAHCIAQASATTPTPSCANTGSVEREVWTGITGGKVSSIPVYKTPNQITTLASLQGPVNAGDNFGSRVRGFLCPPTTGNLYILDRER